MPNDQTNYKKIINDSTEELKEANAKAKNLINEIDKKIAELDLRYEKMVIKDDISKLKMAKDVIKKRWGVKD